MNWIKRLLFRVSRRDRHNEISALIAEHLDEKIDDLVEGGMPRKQAERLAHVQFGNRLRITGESRQVWQWGWAEGLIADLRYALRGLGTAPGYAAASILTLMLGLGSATALFAVIDSVLLRPLPLPHSERLMDLTPSGPDGDNGYFRVADAELLNREANTLEGVASFADMPAAVTTTDGRNMASTLAVSTNLLSVMGVKPALGRNFTSADDLANVVIVSDMYWQQALHANPSVIGSQLKIADRTMTIIGVMPKGFSFPPQSFDAPTLAYPYGVQARIEDPEGKFFRPVIGRLREGVTIRQAQQQIRAVLAHNGSHATGLPHVTSYQVAMAAGEQPALLALFCACLTLLLIACANYANLQIVRMSSRAEEISLRAALGASRARILQQIAIESITVSMLGAIAGLGMAWLLLRAARLAYADAFPRFHELAVHPVTFVLCASLALLTGSAAALAPSVQAIRRSGSGRTVQSRTVTGGRLTGSLVTAEVALTFVLLVAAGLFLRSFRALESAPLGFEPGHVTAIVLMNANQAMTARAARDETTRTVAALAAMPGVDAAANQTAVPLSAFNMTLGPAPFLTSLSSNAVLANVSLISAGYAKTMRTPLLAGRNFLPTDQETSPGVCLVNEVFVRKYMAGRGILGATIREAPTASADPGEHITRGPLTIIGVVADEVSGHAIGEIPPTIFMDYQQAPTEGEVAKMILGMVPQFVVRSPLPATTLEREARLTLRQAAPDMAVMSIKPMDELVASSMSEKLLALRLAFGFGCIALVLAGVGMYGVLAYAVALRTREIGIRMALGSSRVGAVQLVMKRAVWMAACGLAVGAMAVWPAGKVIASLLYGVRPMDGLSIGAAASVMLITCTVATLMPSWRAARVDPVIALRAE